MKSCGYCGRENSDEGVNCWECGTSLVVADPRPSDRQRNVLRPWKPLRPEFRIAVKAGIGVVLILTAILLTIGRLTLDSAEAEHGGKIGTPGIYAVGMLVMFYALPVMALAIPLLGFACVARCKNVAVGIATIGLAVVAVFLVARPFKVLLPVVFIGRMVGTSAGYYVGALVQLVAGAWLLGWFDRWLKPTQNPEATKIENRCSS